MSASFIQRGGFWVVVQFALMIGVVVLGLVWRDGGWGSFAVACGVISLLLGGVFGLAGWAALGRNRTAFPQPRPDSELIKHGIYGRVRHPLYTSVTLISLAWTLLWQSWPALLPTLALIPFFHAKARGEERWLAEKFPGYAEYARRVPRFLPRWKTRTNLVCNF